MTDDAASLSLSYMQERMSLMSPTTAHPLHPSPYHRHTSTNSAADSDGYFSEVFDSEEQDDPAALPRNLTTLISAPLVHSPSSLTFVNKVFNTTLQTSKLCRQLMGLYTCKWVHVAT